MGKKQRRQAPTLRSADGAKSNRQQVANKQQLRHDLTTQIANQHHLNLELVKTIALTAASPIVYQLLQRNHWPTTLAVSACVLVVFIVYVFGAPSVGRGHGEEERPAPWWKQLWQRQQR